MGTDGACGLNIRLYVYSVKLILAAMYLRRIEIYGSSYAAAYSSDV
jgi:hypothetical protein